jgi:ferric-dicitrate binding protein FerR (iron transport regulator)
MSKKSTHINNDTYLAKWLANEITDLQLKKLVTEEDFMAYKKLQRGISLYENLENVNEDAYAELKTKIAAKKKATIRTLYYKWAISVAAVAILFITLTTTLFSKTTVSKTTGYGQNNTIALLDGSEVILNAKSEISYREKQWKANREIFLKGEAFFKVTKGSTFTVRTKNGSVTVLGTQFNVKSVSDYFEVICYAGKVKVTTANHKEYILHPSEGFRKINGNPLENLNENSPKPNWLSDETSYKSVPLKYVLKDIENQFDVVFDTNSVDVNALFTGSFTHIDQEIALKTVLNAMELDYKIQTNKHIVLSKK